MATISRCNACFRTLERQLAHGKPRRLRIDLLRPQRPTIASSSFIRTLSNCVSRHAEITRAAASAPESEIPHQSHPLSTPPAEPNPSPARQNFAHKISNSPTIGTYMAYGLTEKLVQECTRQADYDIQRPKGKGDQIPKAEGGEDLGVGKGLWYTDFKLDATFNTWAQITFLHMYILTVRLRMFPADHAQNWHQHLIDHFFYDAERRMEQLHGLTMRGTRNRYLKDLFVQWRGVVAAYDEGLMRGDAVLASAVWRNVFKAREDVDAVALAQIVAYIRREVARLDRMNDQDLFNGRWAFEGPTGEKNTVLVESQLMKEPFPEEP